MFGAWAFWSPTLFLMSSLLIGCQLPACFNLFIKIKCSVGWIVYEGDERGGSIPAVYG